MFLPSYLQQFPQIVTNFILAVSGTGQYIGLAGPKCNAALLLEAKFLQAPYSSIVVLYVVSTQNLLCSVLFCFVLFHVARHRDVFSTSRAQGHPQR